MKKDKKEERCRPATAKKADIKRLILILMDSNERWYSCRYRRVIMESVSAVKGKIIYHALSEYRYYAMDKASLKYYDIEKREEKTDTG